MTETVQHIYKLIHQLHLVNDDVIQVVILNPVMNIVEHCIRISQLFVYAIFKINANNVVFSYSILQKIVIEQNIQ